MIAKGLMRPEGLTERQKLFVKLYVQGLDANEAAAQAGYVGVTANSVYHLIRSPVVVAAIQAEAAVRIRTEGVTIGLSVLKEIALNKLAPAGARKDCAIALLDRAGIVAQKAKEAPKDPGEDTSAMSLDQLKALVRDLERKRSAAARDVTPRHDAPIIDANEAETVDMFE